jgi:Putative phage tail protein
MSFLTGGGKKVQSAQAPAVSGLQLQSSAFGKAIPLVYGAMRIAPNLIWYGDFQQIAGGGSSSQGGKGGGGGGGKGGGGKGGGGATQPNFQTAVALAVCEGPIAGYGQAWADKTITTPAALGLTTFLGSYPQTPWGYLTTNHPGQDLGYDGVAYLAAAAYQLGNSQQLPNHTFEIFGVLCSTAPGVVDADPSQVVSDFLTNPHYGAGFPAARLGSLATYQSYVLAAGLWISPAYSEQRQASDVLEEIAKNTNSAFVWSSGTLILVPYGDQPLSANAFTYTPPTAPVYDLGDDDFLAVPGQDPVQLTRKRAADALNAIKVEFRNRQNQYNPEIVEAKDQAGIDVFGLRTDSTRQAHLFADANAAQQSAQLQLQR